MVKSISGYTEQPWRRRFPLLLLLQELWYKTPRNALLFPCFYTLLCRVEQRQLRFHALVFTIIFKHRKPTHTNRLQYKSSACSVLPHFTQYTKSPLHAIVLQHKFYEHFPMGLFDMTVCSYLKFWNSWYNYNEKIVIIIATKYDERYTLQYIKRQTL